MVNLDWQWKILYGKIEEEEAKEAKRKKNCEFDEGIQKQIYIH